MSMSDVMSFMPRSILESDDDLDTWSSGGRSSGSSQCSDSGSYNSAKDIRDPNDFRLFQDYFGLSNLLNNIKISEDNPLLCGTQKNLALLQNGRRISWDSDGSDSGVVLSPTLENSSCHYERNFDANVNMDAGMKQLPPPSMRLSKAMREHIISGAYHQQISNRQSAEKVAPPTSPRQPVQPPMLNPPSAAGVPTARPQSGLHVCVFCRNNGESESVYTSHVLKDADGRTSCPILRAYTCPICKANGDSSHTIKYCPMNQNARVPASIGGGVMNQPPQPVVNMAQRNHQPIRPGGFHPPPFPANLSPSRMNPPTVKLRQ